MAAGKGIRLWNNVDQPLKSGEQFVRINRDNDDVSVVVGQNDGVDVVGTVEFNNLTEGIPVHIFWQISDWSEKDSKPKESGIAIPVPFLGRRTAAEVSFKGDIPKPSGAGRSMRLRLVVRVGDAVAGAKMPVINNVHIDGWKMP